MSCPKCGGELNCPCRNCADRNKGKPLWIWDSTGELISCCHCGHTAHADWWQDQEMRATERGLAKVSDDAFVCPPSPMPTEADRAAAYEQGHKHGSAGEPKRTF